MKRVIWCLIFLLLAPAAFAQTANPREQAISGKLMEEINQNLEYRRALIEAQAMIEELKKQIAAKAAEKPKESEK
jgi:hypothetical protein